MGSIILISLLNYVLTTDAFLNPSIKFTQVISNHVNCGFRPYTKLYSVENHGLKTNSSIDYETYSVLKKKLDTSFLSIAFPAFLGLVADPLASIVDAIYVGRLGPNSQAGMGIAISAQYSVAKLYNDPLIKTSTSLVAGKSGDELSASVATAILTAMIIGTMQFFLFVFLADPLMTLMGVPILSGEINITDSFYKIINIITVKLRYARTCGRLPSLACCRRSCSYCGFSLKWNFQRAR